MEPGVVKRKHQDAHPIAGRWGTGPPIAPPGWLWRAGYRLRDMYFTSPSGERFRSQVQLNAYLDANPGSPSLSEFRWGFSRNDYQDGTPMPGNPPPPKSSKRKSEKPQVGSESGKRQMVADGHRKKTPVDQSPESPGYSTPLRLRTFSRLDEEVEQVRRATQVYDARNSKAPGLQHPTNGFTIHRRKRSKTNYTDAGPSTGGSGDAGGNGNGNGRDAQVDDPLVRFLAEGASLAGKSESELAALERLVQAEVKDITSLQKRPVEELRVFYRLIRKEEAPSCFGVIELSKLCSSWICRHRRAWCLREQTHIHVMKDTVERRTQKEAVADADRLQLEKRLISSGNCKRESCCAESSFCSGCNCTSCKGVVATKLCWSYLRCQHCCHVAHLDCAVRERRAGVVKERGLDVEYLCATCLQKTSLVPFWKARIRDAFAVVERALAEHHLAAAGRVVKGTERVSLRHLQSKVNALQHVDQGCSELLQVTDLVDLVYDDRLMDQSIVAEMVEANEPLKLDSGEEAVKSSDDLRKKAESEYSRWLTAEQVVETRRTLLVQLQKEVENAEQEAKRKAELAASSKAAFRKAEKKVQVVEMLKAMNGVSGDVVELQRWVCDQEKSELQTLLHKKIAVGDVNQLSVLCGALKAQDKRVKAAQNRLEQLVALQKLLP